MNCNRCGTVKPRPKVVGPAQAIGEGLASSSKGLFNKDDWQCPMCGNINWLRRDTCNVCNHPKVGKIEERDGLGGGFKENDNVEYKEHDSDSELYDEFGRKKKKFRQTQDASEPPAPAPAEKAAQAEASKDAGAKDAGDYDDDDDDDEDVDLSKYELDADDDDAEEGAD